jgi:hypothetical protein
MELMTAAADMHVKTLFDQTQVLVERAGEIGQLAIIGGLKVEHRGRGGVGFQCVGRISRARQLRAISITGIGWQKNYSAKVQLFDFCWTSNSPRRLFGNAWVTMTSANWPMSC